MYINYSEVASLIRYFYSLILGLALPFLFVRLWWRSRSNPDYQQRWSERLGFFPRELSSASIWLHAVSLGEAVAATPLIKFLLQRYPDLPLVITSTTPTGSAYINKHFKDQVIASYLPFDLSFLLKRFLKRAKPKLCIIMETELWPNLLHCCQRQNIHVILANARLSNSSARGYARIKFIVKKMLNSLTWVIAQSDLDAQNFLSLGLQPEKLLVAGNIKFDLQLPDGLQEQALQLRQQLGQDRLIWAAASTHAGEEEIILQAFKRLRINHPNLLLILVPRHADRFDTVAELCGAHVCKVARRSLNEFPTADTDIYLSDTFGEMLLLYAASHMAFVGGSLVPVGGHNLIEPAALALPILSGPNLHNFTKVSELLLAEN
ncbi:MAG TPA: lipid IV(A) 3-deoxy-D-manno-octulosonic acid transferase, partial [Coxiellaceae bacterium]|nr:lipid IV(A) 3-deoxy-D-manno-octulosonic acid transferase [Coxiellaceae bacterium]